MFGYVLSSLCGDHVAFIGQSMHIEVYSCVFSTGAANRIYEVAQKRKRVREEGRRIREMRGKRVF